MASLTRFPGDLGMAWHQGQLNIPRPPWRARTHPVRPWAVRKAGQRSSPPFPLHRVAEQPDGVRWPVQAMKQHCVHVHEDLSSPTPTF